MVVKDNLIHISMTRVDVFKKNILMLQINVR